MLVPALVRSDGPARVSIGVLENRAAGFRTAGQSGRSAIGLFSLAPFDLLRHPLTVTALSNPG